MYSKVHSIIFTVRKRSCGKVMFSEVCVKNSVHREGRCSPPWVDTPLQGRHPLLGRHPPWADTPPRKTPPPGQTPHASRQLLQWTVRILLECILVHKYVLKVVKDTTLGLVEYQFSKCILVLIASLRIDFSVGNVTILKVGHSEGVVTCPQAYRFSCELKIICVLTENVGMTQYIYQLILIQR